MGDINIDVSNISNSMSRKYLEVLSSVGFENLVDIPTRYGSSSQTVIDHIITNCQKEDEEHSYSHKQYI